MPANRFELMTFALQKRCSTAELSRHGLHRTGCLAIQGELFIPDKPKHQLESIATYAFPECPADVALNGAMTDHQQLGDGSVVKAFEQQQNHPLFSGGEEVRDLRFQA